MPIADPNNRPPSGEVGLTLIELLLVAVMLGIALQMTLPGFARRADDLRSAMALRHLSSLLAYARYEALLRERSITVCAVDSDGRCQRDWSSRHRIEVFMDDNANRQRDSNELVLRSVTWPLERGTLSWRASLGRNYLRFAASGSTWQNGTLYYCPDSRDRRFARALVVSQSGRSYLTVDSDGNGIREDRSGRDLTC